MKISKERLRSIIKEELEKIYSEEFEEIPTNENPQFPSIPDDVMKNFEMQKKAGNKIFLDYDLNERAWKLMGDEQGTQNV